MFNINIGDSLVSPQQIENLIYHYQSMPYLEKANKISKNGRYLSYLRAFANEYSKFYNMTWGNTGC